MWTKGTHTKVLLYGKAKQVTTKIGKLPRSTVDHQNTGGPQKFDLVQDPVQNTCSSSKQHRSQQLKGRNMEQWQTPRKTCQVPHTKTDCSTQTLNPYQVLETLQDNSQELSSLDENSLTQANSKPVTKKMSKAKLKPNKDVNQLDETLWKPHESSYFIPGKIDRCTANFLLDTGCTTNLLAKHVFDKLPMQIKDEVQSHESHGFMADGTRLPFYGLIKIPIRLRDVKTEETFVISSIKEDAILGMPFFKQNKCTIEFEQSTMKIGSRFLRCTDRLGRSLTSKVQVVQQMVLPPSSESHFICRINTQAHQPMGIVERTEGSHW